MGTYRLLAALLFASTHIYGANLTGMVRDTSGQGVPRSRVTVFSRDNRVQFSVLTDETGRYRFARLAAGEYLAEAEAAGLTRPAAAPVMLTDVREARLDFTLGLPAVYTQVVVTATGAAQSTDEIAKSVDVLGSAVLSRRAEPSLAEPLQTVPGVRVQTLGGPGAYTRVLVRGLRPQDTAVTIDGMRFRDAATTQGDATTFIEDLFMVNAGRVEMLRGTGSSIYGTHAIGGVMNVVTDDGGGPLHGDIRAEGGGLGMMRGLARLAGGTAGGRFGYSAGLQHLNALRGVDGDDRFRNSSVQGSVEMRVANSASLSARVWGSDSFGHLNITPYAAPAGALPAGDVLQVAPVSLETQRRIEARQPFSWTGANFVPNLNDPDSTRAARFLNSALVFSQQLTPRISYRVSYQKVITRRRFDDGPAGVRFPPLFSISDRIRGGIDTVQGRTDMQLARWNLLSVGYEYERETHRSEHIDFAPPSLGVNYSTAAGLRSHSVFFSEQFRLLRDRLQLGLSGRMQQFELRMPEFAGGPSLYGGIALRNPPRAKTGDASAAYLIAGSGTKLRAHVGNGYRAPSIFERFGTSFYEGRFTPLGDPRIRPDRSLAFDTGVDQYLLGQKVQVSGTWFYTNLQEVIAFDFSGFLNALLDPYGRAGGYINTGGGIARGVELSVEASPLQTLHVNAAYTYTNADQRRSMVRDRDFFGMPFIAANQFSLTATQRIGRRLDLIGDVRMAGEHAAIFSSRAFLFPGPRKVDLQVNYTVGLTERARVRLYTKASNIFDSEYLEGGYRVPGRWGIGGVSVEF